MHTRARPTRGDPFHIRTRTRTHFLFQGRLELVIEISYAICSMGGVTFAFFASFRGRRRGGCIFVILGIWHSYWAILRVFVIFGDPSPGDERGVFFR